MGKITLTVTWICIADQEPEHLQECIMLHVNKRAGRMRRGFWDAKGKRWFVRGESIKEWASERWRPKNRFTHWIPEPEKPISTI